MLATVWSLYPSLFCVDLKYLNGPLRRASYHYPYVGRWPWLDAVEKNLAFVGADFHVVTNSSFIHCCELLEFFFTASQRIDIVSKPPIAKRSSSDGHSRQWRVILSCIICKAGALKLKFPPIRFKFVDFWALQIYWLKRLDSMKVGLLHSKLKLAKATFRSSSVDNRVPDLVQVDGHSIHCMLVISFFQSL